MNPIARRAWTALAFLAFVPCVALPQEDDPGLRIENALLEYLEAPQTNAEDFLTDWVAEATRAELDPESAVQSLEAIHRQLHGGEPMDITIDAQGELVVEFGTPAGGPVWLHCVLQSEPPHHIRNLQIEAGPIFATGSAPIDFTFVAILLLQQAGKLDLVDPITKHFPEVPTDRDPNHGWIDRDEAMRRLFAGDLRDAANTVVGPGDPVSAPDGRPGRPRTR